MKVIFLQDVPRVAQAGEIKDVADGFARNYLIPQKLARLADTSSLSTFEAQLKSRERQQVQEHENLAEVARQLEGKEIALKAKVGTQEHLYGSITSSDIADEMKKVTGLEIDKRKIELDEPIKQLGTHEVTIKLGKDLVPKIKVIVTQEDAS